MADNPGPDKTDGKEAVVGVKANVTTLQQLSSSGRAAQQKRENNQAQNGFKSLGEAVQDHFRGERSGDQENTGQEGGK